MKIPYEKVERLEKMAMALERMKKQDNPIIQDMNWLVEELRQSWIREDKNEKSLPKMQ